MLKNNETLKLSVMDVIIICLVYSMFLLSLSPLMLDDNIRITPHCYYTHSK